MITVNGSNFVFKGSTISYGQILKLLGVSEDRVLSVIYTRGKNGETGILMKGQSVEVTEGIRFNADDTSNA